MKRILTTFTIFLYLYFASTHRSVAQGLHRQEVQIGFSPWAREHVINDFGENFFGAFGNKPSPKLDFSNAYTITYRYQPRRRLALSAMFGFTTHTTYETDYAASRQSGYLMAFETKMSYVDKRVVQLYAVTGLGLLLIRASDFRPSDDGKITRWPTCQLTPIGIRIGQKVGGFAELGFGYKGILNGGMRVRF